MDALYIIEDPGGNPIIKSLSREPQQARDYAIAESSSSDWESLSEQGYDCCKVKLSIIEYA